MDGGAGAAGLRPRVWVEVRLFGISTRAGADPDGELGERHDPKTHLIPLVLRIIEHAWRWERDLGQLTPGKHCDIPIVMHDDGTVRAVWTTSVWFGRMLPWRALIGT